MPSVDRRAFRGFGPQALPFLKALAFHQTKDWFDANRAVYDSDLKGPMGDLVETLAVEFARQNLPLTGERKSSLFRINRDVRFAKDKRPYKTNCGAVMTRGGSKKEPGLFYIHVAPEGCFTATGFYQPEPQPLAHLRAAMARAPGAWKRLLARLASADLAPSAEYALTRSPRGYEATEDAELAAGLKLKSIVVVRAIPETRIAAPELIDDLVAFAKDSLPLLEWGWAAVVEKR